MMKTSGTLEAAKALYSTGKVVLSWAVWGAESWIVVTVTQSLLCFQPLDCRGQGKTLTFSSSHGFLTAPTIDYMVLHCTTVCLFP